MTTAAIPELRAEYLAALADASVVYREIRGPADATYEQARQEAAAAKTTLTRAEVTAFVSARQEAARAWLDIVNGPAARLDAALAAAKKESA